MHSNVIKKFSVLALVVGFAFAASGGEIFNEDFSEITTGNSTASNGSSSQWSGNENFPTVLNAYKAGGAVRLGKSGTSGSLTSKSLDLSGGKVTVSFLMKGWPTAGKTVTVSLGSGQSKVVSCEPANLATDGFEAKSVEFTAGAVTDTLVFTSGERVFLDDISVTVTDTGGGDTPLPTLTANPVSLTFETIPGVVPDAQTVAVTANNQSVDSLTVTVGEDFEFSIDDGASYASSAELTLSDGSVNTNILVRPIAAAVASKGIFDSQLTIAESNTVSLILSVVDPREELLLAEWSFGGVSGVGTLEASEKDPAVQSATITLGDGITVGSSANRIGGSKFNVDSCDAAVAAAMYFDIELAARRLRTLEFERLSVPATRSATGPTSAQWFAKIGGGNFVKIGGALGFEGTSATLTLTAADFSGLGIVNSGEKAVLRLVAWGASSATGSFYLGGGTSAKLDVYGYPERSEGAPSEPQLSVNADREKCNAGELVNFTVAATIEDGFEVAVTVAVDGGEPQPLAKDDDGGWQYNWAPISVGIHSLVFTAVQTDDPENSASQSLQMPVGLSVPQNLAAEAGLRKLTVGWDAVIGAEKYEVSVYRNFGPFETKAESAFDWVSSFGNLNTEQGTIEAGQTAISLPVELTDAGWTAGEKLYPARTVDETSGNIVTNGAVRIGTGTALGWLCTPELDLSGNDGQYSIAFRAARWKNDAGDGLLVVVTDAITGTAVTNTVANLPSGEFAEYEITGVGGTSRTKVMFCGRQDANCRVFLDDIKVKDGIERVAVATGIETAETQLIVPFETELPANAVFSVETLAAAGDVRSLPAKTESKRTPRGTILLWR